MTKPVTPAQPLPKIGFLYLDHVLRFFDKSNWRDVFGFGEILKGEIEIEREIEFILIGCEGESYFF